jgi:hypothetical protein
MEAIEAAIVGLIVVVSVAYSVWRLTSARFHLRVIDVLGRISSAGWVARLRNRELAKLGSACGSCAANVKLKVHGPVTHSVPADRNQTPAAPHR